MKKPTTLLIDGDLVLYRSCAAVEKEVRWDEENHVLFANEEAAKELVVSELDSLFSRFKTKQHVIALTKGPNFRNTIYPPYKSHRAGTRKPICYQVVREWLEETYRVVKLPGLEADDVLGIFGTRDPNTIVCSMDKDMKGVPCTLWDGKEVQVITEAQADYWHMMQTLTGDTTDGYPGCPGVGPKKAVTILEGVVDDPRGDRWHRVVDAYEKANLTEEDALTQARVARILRDSDWDSERKEPKLWTPVQ